MCCEDVLRVVLGKTGASHSLLVTTLLLLLLRRWGCAFLLLVHDEARVALFGIPLEAREVGSIADLVVCLLSCVSRLIKTRKVEWRDGGADGWQMMARRGG